MNVNRRIELHLAKLMTYKEQIRKDLLMKFEREDYHGVQDAASDIRDIDAEIQGLEFTYELTREVK